MPGRKRSGPMSVSRRGSRCREARWGWREQRNPRRIYFGCQWSGRRERPGQAGAEIETGAQRLARRAGERCAQQDRLQEQRHSRIRQQRRETRRSGDQRRQMRDAGQLQRERTQTGRLTSLKISHKSRGHRQEVYTSRKRDICGYVTTRDFLYF